MCDSTALRSLGLHTWHILPSLQLAVPGWLTWHDGGRIRTALGERHSCDLRSMHLSAGLAFKVDAAGNIVCLDSIFGVI